MNLYEQQAANERSTWLLVAAYIALLALLGLGFDVFVLRLPLPGGAQVPGGVEWPVGTLFALMFGGITSLVGYRSGPSMVLAAARAREADPGQPKEKVLLDVVSEMALASGLPMPKVYVVPDPSPNAFATGTGPDDSAVAATQGLLQSLNREELQGVIGHEMSHIRNYDVRLMTILAALGGAIALLSDWSGRSYRYGGSRSDRDDDRGGGGSAVFFVLWLILMILAPLLSQLLAMAVSRERESLADASGAELTRNPLALASALERIDESTAHSAALNQGLAHLWIADPKETAIGEKSGFLADLLATHPPIQARIAALKSMAGQRASTGG